jgi:hypothetical protein
VVLGICVGLALKPPLWAAAIIVGVFAIFHGYAHGAEMPDASNAVSYALGFVIATGALHLLGIGFGSLARWPAGKAAVRGWLGHCGDRRRLPDRCGLSRRRVLTGIFLVATLVPREACAHGDIAGHADGFSGPVRTGRHERAQRLFSRSSADKRSQRTRLSPSSILKRLRRSSARP